MSGANAADHFDPIDDTPLSPPNRDWANIVKIDENQWQIANRSEKRRNEPSTIPRLSVKDYHSCKLLLADLTPCGIFTTL